MAGRKRSAEATLTCRGTSPSPSSSLWLPFQSPSPRCHWTDPRPLHRHPRRRRPGPRSRCCSRLRSTCPRRRPIRCRCCLSSPPPCQVSVRGRNGNIQETEQLHTMPPPLHTTPPPLPNSYTQSLHLYTQRLHLYRTATHNASTSTHNASTSTEQNSNSSNPTEQLVTLPPLPNSCTQSLHLYQTAAHKASTSTKQLHTRPPPLPNSCTQSLHLY